MKTVKMNLKSILAGNRGMANATKRGAKKYVKADIMDVGQITNLFDQFKDRILKLKNLERYSLEKQDYILKESRAHFVTAFGIKTEGANNYVSPFGEETHDEFGKAHRDVEMGKVKELVEAIQNMALTIPNMLAVCEDLCMVGRGCQEMAIDAAKTAEPITVPASSTVKSVKVAARQGFGFSIDHAKDQGNKLSFTEEKKYSGFEGDRKKGPFVIVDEGYKAIIKNTRDIIVPVVDDYIGQVLTLSDEFKNDCEKVFRKYIAVVPVLAYVKQAYMTLNGGKKQEVERLLPVKTSDKDVVAAVEASVKDRFRDSYMELTNMARIATSHMNPYERACLFIQVCLLDKKKNSDDTLSGIVHNLLPEEFMHVVLRYGDSAVTYTEDYLKIVDGFVAGDVAVFKDGRAIKDCKIAIAESGIPDGEYRFEENAAGKLVIRRDILDVLSIPAINEDTRIVMTSVKVKDSTGIEDAKKVSNQLIGKKAVLGTFFKKGCSVNDSIIIDGKKFADLRTSVGRRYETADDTMLDKVLTADLNKEGGTIFNRYYHGKMGTIDNVIVTKTRNDKKKKDYYTVFFTLKDCINLPKEALAKIGMQAELNAKAEERAKNANKVSASKTILAKSRLIGRNSSTGVNNAVKKEEPAKVKSVASKLVAQAGGLDF